MKMMSVIAGTLAAVLLATLPLAAKPAAEPLTRANWTRVAGFEPDLTGVPGWRAGEVLDAATWKKAQPWVPEGLARLIEEWGLKVRMAPYRPIRPTAGYIEATNRYHAGVTAVETPHKDYRTKGIRGYVAGLPFPAPETALEVAFNQHYAPSGDDGTLHFAVMQIDDKRGVERTEEWKWEFISRAMHRTDLPPLPDIPWFRDQGIQYASLSWALEPADKAGQAALYYRYETPKDQQGWAWLPAMRRDLKMLFGTPGVTWNFTDFLWEDIRGYSGFPEWMSWTLVGKATVIAPMHAGVAIGKNAAGRTFDFGNAPHWNPRLAWEPRPVYVIEGRPKMDTTLSPHPYGKVVMYVDAETWQVPLKVAYDRKGQLWKVFVNAWNESPDPDRLPPPMAMSLGVDLRDGHATVMPTYDVRNNVGLDRARFTETFLRTMGM